MPKSMKLSATLTTLILFFVGGGLIALMLGDRRVQTSDDAALTFGEFDQVIKNPVACIEALALAEYLIAQKEHYLLIDLQGAQADYRIPTAEVVSIDAFLAQQQRVNETIFIYAQHELEAMQLYYLLYIRGYFKVKILKGGIAAWREQVLFPLAQSIAPAERDRRAEISRFFGGALRMSDNQTATAPQPVELSKKIKYHQGC